ncbi:MAG: ABC transporter ATP-binding protein [Proteobacteria bacterium]|nr:ABC transporter ATP-binding protein [Pseudomonadota bacterium]
MSVRRGEVVTVIGANGAGKSSLLNAIVGVVPAQATTLWYAGADVSRMSPEALVRRGVTLVPERRELFADLTVDDNLRLGAYHRGGKDGAVQGDLARVYSIFPRLAERKRQRASTMSGGEQQMLAVGRAMMTKPELLLLDEPSLGLAPLIVQEIFRVLAQLKAAGTTVLVIEQNARAALNLADYGYVLETGKVVLSAPADALYNDTRVREAYLGVVPKTDE